VFILVEYAALLEAVSTAADSVTKGKSLEDLIAYLLEAVPGYRSLRRNTLNDFATEEIDISYMHQQDHEGLWFLPPLLLVECKNWSQPVDSQATSYFADRIRSRGCEVGILVAASGVTGRAAGPTAAQFVSAMHLARDGIRILVVTLQDLQRLRSPQDFVVLLQDVLLDMVASGSYLPSRQNAS
jgi:hypothetical protein